MKPLESNHFHKMIPRRSILLVLILAVLVSCTRSTSTGNPNPRPPPTSPVSDPSAEEACTRLQEIADYNTARKQIPHALIERSTDKDDADYNRVTNLAKNAAGALVSAAVRVKNPALSDAARFLGQAVLAGRAPEGVGSDIPEKVDIVVKECAAEGFPLKDVSILNLPW